MDITEGKEMIYEYDCNVCGRTFEEFRSYAKRNDTFCCNVKANKHIATGRYINDDLMYNFVSDQLGNNPVQIHSKRQFNRLCKEQGLVYLTKDDRTGNKPKDNSHKLAKAKDRAMKRIAADGLTKHVEPLIRTVSTPLKPGQRMKSLAKEV